GPLHRSRHPQVPPSEGRPDRRRQVVRASPVPPGAARPDPHQGVRVPAAAAGEAEGPLHLRPAREADARLLRGGEPSRGQDRRRVPAPARVASRLGRLPRRARPDPSPGPPAGGPRPLPGQRPEGRRPQLPGDAVRHHRRPGQVPEHAAPRGGQGELRRPPGTRVAAGGPGHPAHLRPPAPGAVADRHARLRAADRRVLLEV
ncbi:MAG: SSU ribosomal protein S4p (S9e) @ SSU ribosomal protein S4p (S9e), zinc-independent, partial [uncultured Actinomycetospora sp.]